MDYKHDYQMILNDVNQQIYNLSFDFLRKTYHLTGLKETRHQSLTEFFTILQHVFGQLVQAVERIQERTTCQASGGESDRGVGTGEKAGEEEHCFPH